MSEPPASPAGSDGSTVPVSLRVDGKPHRLVVPSEMSALSLFRDVLGIRSVKAGCAPEGVCGACTVVVDGKARTTCRLRASRLEGSEVRTLEGLPPAHREILVRAFGETGGTQCGFCTPGLVLRTWALLQDHHRAGTLADLEERAIRRALQPHLCRCTGWQGILRAVRAAASAWPASGTEAPSPLAASRRSPVGSSPPRPEHRASVLGERPFVRDLPRQDLLYGALVWTPYPRCRVERVDPAEARAMPGVHAVALPHHFPGERRGGLVARDWPVMVAEGEETRCVADVLAAVAAESPEAARRAAERVQVTAHPLPGVFHLEEAARDPERILATTRIQRGDTADAFARAAVVVEEEFRTQLTDQAFLEPEAAVVRPRPGGGYRLWSASQGAFDDHAQLCRLFGLAPHELEVEHVRCGGGFGGREDLSVQPHALVLAHRTGRPVEVALQMAESLRFHPKRHPMILRYTVSADARGHITAVRARILADTGGYASVGAKVVERAALHAAGPYRVPAVDVEARAVYTHNPVAGAMRGFGVNQVAFALEGCVDRIAERLQLDPLEIRLANALRRGDRTPAGQRLPPDSGMRSTLEALAPHYREARRRGHAVGLAAGMKSVGLGGGVRERCRILLEVLDGERVAIWTAFAEMGQGHETVMAQFAADASGLPYSCFHPRCNTGHAATGGMTTSSRATWMGGRAAQQAGRALGRALKETGGALAPLEGRTFVGEYLAPRTAPPGDAESEAPHHYSYGYAAQVALLDAEGRVARIVAAQDVGRAIHPTQCRGQLEGAVHMGLGFALTEQMEVKEGVPETRLGRQGVIRAGGMPPVEVVLVECPDPQGPAGARGVGELGLVPTAPAVAAALHEHDGIWRSRLPMQDTEASRACRRGWLAKAPRTGEPPR